jgi:hypothetical protein
VFQIQGDPHSNYYSNGNTADCGYASWEQFVTCTGRSTAEGIPSYPEPECMVYNRPCAACSD